MPADDLLEKVAARIAEIVIEKLRPVLDDRPKKLYTLREVSEILGRSKPAVQHLCATGQIPTIRHDRRVHVAKEDLDKWIEQNKTV